MSDSQDNLLDYEGDKVQGEDILDQSMERESLEDDAVVLEEEQQVDPGLKLACDDNDIFNEDSITDYQLVKDVNTLTQENLEGPVQSPEVEEIPLPEPIEVVESEQDSADPSRDRQDMGLVDPSLSPQSVEEIPLGQEDSRQEVEQRSHQSEPNGQRVQDYVQEAWQRASHQDTSNAISGHSSKPLEVSNRRLGFVGESMLHDWYQPERSSVWPEQKVFGRLRSLMLAPE